MAIIKPQQQQGVGNTIKERRDYLQHQGAAPSQFAAPAVGRQPAAQDPRQVPPSDNFGGAVAKKHGDAKRFAANAVFGGTLARVTTGVPYQRPLHHKVEVGRQNSGPVAVTDPMRLRFLDRIIAEGPKRSAAPAGTPKAAVAARPVAKAPAVQRAAAAPIAAQRFAAQAPTPRLRAKG